MRTILELEAFLIQQIAAALKHAMAVDHRRALSGSVPLTPAEKTGVYATDLRSRVMELTTYPGGTALRDNLCNTANYTRLGHPVDAAYVWRADLTLSSGMWHLHNDKAKEMFAAARNLSEQPDPDEDEVTREVNQTIERVRSTFPAFSSLIIEMELLNAERARVRAALEAIL
jgi:hypothetical protein